MPWQSLNSWSRCLTLSNCLPASIDGSIPLSAVGGSVHLPSLFQALIPGLTISDWGGGWAFKAWSEGEAEAQGERFLNCLEWLVLSDSGSARRLLEIAVTVMTPAEAMRVAGALATASDATGHAALRHAARAFLFADTRPPDSNDPILTRSQAGAFTKVSAMAQAYFIQAASPCSIAPRFAPLLVGPTGVGKSSLLRRVSDAHQATFVRTSIGEWIVLGARHSSPTLPGILDALKTGPVVLLVDELDKVAFDGSGWSRSVMAEIFSLLDRSVPREALATLKESSASSLELESFVRKKLFIVGAGTWQHAWSHNSTIGFGALQSDSKSRVLSQIAAEKVVPIELLLRFSCPPIALEYPLAEETQELFDRTGLTHLAKLAGVALDPINHDWTRGGMRSMESLVGDLMLRIQSPPQSMEVFRDAS